jgi:hypothetical protein
MAIVLRRLRCAVQSRSCAVQSRKCNVLLAYDLHLAGLRWIRPSRLNLACFYTVYPKPVGTVHVYYRIRMVVIGD